MHSKLTQTKIPGYVRTENWKRGEIQEIKGFRGYIDFVTSSIAPQATIKFMARNRNHEIGREGLQSMDRDCTR